MIGEVWRGPLWSLKLYVEFWYMWLSHWGGGRNLEGAHNVLKKKYYVERSIKLLSPSEISFCLLLIVTGITSCIH